MKIRLVVTDTKRKSLVFINDSLRAMSLEEAVYAADKGAFESAYSVAGKFGTYIRSLPNASEKDNLDTLSVTAADIIAYVNRTRHFQSTDAISLYAAQYSASVLESGKPFIKSVDGDKVFVSVVRDIVTLHAKIIVQAAREFSIDLYLLGAILIDEIVRMFPFEDIRDRFLLQLLGRNVSVGIAQVKLETANNVIKKGLYNPNPKDKKLPFTGTLSNKDRKHLYQYVVDPKYNFRFAAAYIRDVITVWAKYIDLAERSEIIATLYSKGYGDPKFNPVASKRGTQIVDEFYPLARKWLSRT